MGFSLAFEPLSDQWVEIYLEGVRMINTRYATQKTNWLNYEVYNQHNGEIQFQTPVTGNIKVVCDYTTRSRSEIADPNMQGIIFDVENIQSYDVYEKNFNPARYATAFGANINGVGLYNTAIRNRVGDALYTEPIVIRQPMYGHVRITENRRNMIYVPKKNFYGWDSFTYTLLTQHGQIGKPECCSVRVFSDGDRLNWSADFDGNQDYYLVPPSYTANITALTSSVTVIEFYIWVRASSPQANFTSGIFGQFPNAAQNDRWGVFIRGTDFFSDQVIVFAYSTGVNTFARISTQQKIKQRRWNHIVITIDPTVPAQSTIWIYVNGQGERFRNQNLSSQTGNNGNAFYLGAVNDWTFGEKITQWFRGYISNFRLIRGNLIYSGETITIPNLPLDANVVGNVICTVQSQGLDLAGNVAENSRQYRLERFGNAYIKEFGPFSPVWFELDKTELWHGDELTIRMNSSVIPVDTVIDYSITGNITTTNLGVTSLSGNFIVEEKETLKCIIDTVSAPLQGKTDVVIRFHQYPLMFAEFTIYRSPDSCIAYYDSGNVDSYYGFGNNWIDLINFSNITVPTPVTYSNEAGGVFKFAGTTASNVALPNHEFLNLRGDMTCEVWFKIDAASTDWVRVAGKGGLTERTYGLLYNNSTNEFAFERVNPDGNLQVKTSTTISTTSWYQLVGTTDYKVHKLYVNGMLASTEIEDMSPFLANSYPTQMGSADFGQPHTGNISILRLYNRALSASEVLDNFNQHRTRYGL